MQLIQLQNTILAAGILILALLVPCKAQVDFGQIGMDVVDRPSFGLDVAQFRSDSAGLTRVEVYYKVTNAGVTFVKTDSGYQAGYELHVSLSSDNSPVANQSEPRKLLVKEFERTTLSTDFVLSQMTFYVPPGKYKIIARIEDRSDGQTSSSQREYRVRDFSPNGAPKLSGIEFLHSTPTADGAPRFRKGELTLVPVVERSFAGGADGTPLLLYFEVYGAEEKDQNTLLDLRLRSHRGRQVYRDTLTIPLRDPMLSQLRSIPLDGLQPGLYTVEITLRGSRNKAITQESAEFLVQWSLLSMVRENYETVLQQLSYIGEYDEMNSLEKAKTPEERVVAWREFWQKRDPSPDTEENEARDAFYNRLRFANRAFGSLRKEGWRTDRGRVLLKYGAPDESVDEPMNLQSGAFEIWYYHNYKGESLRFVFRDEFGDGDYRLQYPFDGRTW